MLDPACIQQDFDVAFLKLHPATLYNPDTFNQGHFFPKPSRMLGSRLGSHREGVRRKRVRGGCRERGVSAAVRAGRMRGAGRVGACVGCWVFPVATCYNRRNCLEHFALVLGFSCCDVLTRETGWKHFALVLGFSCCDVLTRGTGWKHFALVLGFSVATCYQEKLSGSILPWFWVFPVFSAHAELVGQLFVCAQKHLGCWALVQVLTETERV